MGDQTGPVESVLKTPGFKLFWDRLIEDLRTLYDSHIREAMSASKDGNRELADAFLKRAAGVDDVIIRMSKAPLNMINKEKGYHHAGAESAGSGYSGVA